MKDLYSQYILTLQTLSAKYGVELDVFMDPGDVCGKLEICGYEPLHPSISNTNDIMMWLIESSGLRKPQKKSAKKRRKFKPSKHKGFYGTEEWRALRLDVFKLYGKQCLRCGAKKKIHVDHIFPRSRYKYLELDIDNLQPLCKSCNDLKLNTSYWDYRPVSDEKKLELLSKIGCDDLKITAPDRKPFKKQPRL